MKILLLISFIFYSLTAFSSAELYKSTHPRVVKIVLKKFGLPISQGSGFFLGPDGIIVTNAHVIGEFSKDISLEVTTSSGKKLTNVRIAHCEEKEIDLCFLKVDERSTAYFNVTNKEMELGEKIFVLGHSLGLEYTFSDGLLSGKRRNHELNPKAKKDFKLYQVSAPVSPGNSGGPIFNSTGDFVGVTTFMLSKQHAQNLNFAIAAEEVINIYSRLKDEDFLLFNDLLQKKLEPAQKVFQVFEKRQKEFLSLLRDMKLPLHRLGKPTEIKDTNSPLILKLYSPPALGYRCTSMIDDGYCQSVLHVNTLIAFSTKTEIDKDLKESQEQHNKPSKFYEELKKKNSDLDNTPGTKIDEKFVTKFHHLGCATEAAIFYNKEKEFTVCNYAHENSVEPGGIFLLKVIGLGENSYLVVLTQFEGKEHLAMFMDHQKVILAFTELQKNGAPTSRPLIQDDILSRNIKGTVLDAFYTDSMTKLRVKYKASDEDVRTVYLPIEINDYKLSNISSGDQFELNFESTKYEFERFLISKIMTVKKYQFKNLSSREEVITNYKVSKLDIKPDEVGITMYKDGVRTRAYFYGKALANLSKLSLEEGDMVSLPPADLIQDYRVNYISGKEFKKIVASPGSVTGIAIAAKPVKALNSRPEKLVSGVIKVLKYYLINGDSRLDLEIESAGKTYNFLLQTPQNQGNFDALPLLDKDDEVMITVDGNVTSSSSGKFYLKHNEFKIRALKTANKLQQGFKGKIRHLHKEHNDYIRFTLKTAEGDKVIYIYDPDGKKTLKTMSISNGDEMSLDQPDFFSNGEYYIYTKKIKKFEFLKINK